MTDPRPADPADIPALWEFLSGRPVTALRQAKLSVRVGKRHAGVAIDAFGVKHVLIPVSRAPAQKGIWKSSRVFLDRRDLEAPDGKASTFLDLYCTDSLLNDTFIRLVQDLLLQLPDTSANVLPVCTGILDDWQDLLGAPGRKGLGMEELTGLIGELLDLDRLAEISPQKALESWQSPHGAVHDFRKGHFAIESKATTRRKGLLISIHGIRQLEPPEDGTLHLSVTRLERVSRASVSVNILLKRLRSRGIAAAAIDALLQSRGCSRQENEETFNATYNVTDRRLYEVDDGFPRIVPASFREGAPSGQVVDLEYVIDLTGDHPRPLGDTEVEQVWKRLI